MEETTDIMYHAQGELLKIEEENSEHATSSSMMPNSSFLADLNLVMVIAALTLSSEEILELEDMEKVSAKEQDVNAFVSRLQSRNRKRGFDELKVPDRRASRSHTRVLDTRHGRKM